MALKFAEETMVNRVGKLVRLIDDLSRPDPSRDPDTRRILEPFFVPRYGTIHTPKFSMDIIYSGKQHKGGKWQVVQFHPVGLAALHPWFHDQGLRHAVVTHPKDTDTLDPFHVMLFHPKEGTWHPETIEGIGLAEFFGIGPADWAKLVDNHLHFEDYKSLEHSLSLGHPFRVNALLFMRRLYRLTGMTHGTIDPSPHDPEESTSRAKRAVPIPAL